MRKTVITFAVIAMAFVTGCNQASVTSVTTESSRKKSTTTTIDFDAYNTYQDNYMYEPDDVTKAPETTTTTKKVTTTTEEQEPERINISARIGETLKMQTATIKILSVETIDTHPLATGSDEQIIKIVVSAYTDKIPQYSNEYYSVMDFHFVYVLSNGQEIGGSEFSDDENWNLYPKKWNTHTVYKQISKDKTLVALKLTDPNNYNCTAEVKL